MSMKPSTKNELFSWLFRIGCITFAYSIRLITVDGEFYAVFWQGVCEMNNAMARTPGRHFFALNVLITNANFRWVDKKSGR
jgi:hypothetical protein